MSELRDILLLRRNVVRGEYFVLLAVNWVVVIALMFMIILVAEFSGWAALFIGLLGFPFAFYLLFAVIAARARDAGHSSWIGLWTLLLLPLSPVLMVMVGFAPSKEHYKWVPAIDSDIFD